MELEQGEGGISKEGEGSSSSSFSERQDKVVLVL